MSAKKADNPETMALAKTAIEIARELKTVVDSVIEAGGECNDETFAALKSWEAALEVKAENIGFVKARLESDISYFKSIEQAAASRRKTAERAWDGLKRYLAVVMKEANITKIKKNDGLFTVSLVAGRTSVAIDRPEALPMDCLDVVEVYKPRTETIKAKLEAGQEVTGAHLETGDDYVMIRDAGSGNKE